MRSQRNYMIKKFFTTLWGAPDKGLHNEPDPADLSIDNAYKTRWIWYHTILGIELFLVNVLLVAILVVLAIKL